jgi:hypothetical protein
MRDDDEVELPPILLPGYESRQLARAIIVLTGLLLLVTALLFIAAPPGQTAMIQPDEAAPPLWIVVPLAGIGGVLFGFAWMVRIYRSSFDVEPDHGNWRYRAR